MSARCGARVRAVSSAESAARGSPRCSPHLGHRQQDVGIIRTFPRERFGIRIRVGPPAQGQQRAVLAQARIHALRLIGTSRPVAFQRLRRKTAPCEHVASQSMPFGPRARRGTRRD